MNILYNILSLTEPNMLDGAALFLCQSLVQILYSCGTCSFFGFESENNNKVIAAGLYVSARDSHYTFLPIAVDCVY